MSALPLNDRQRRISHFAEQWGIHPPPPPSPLSPPPSPPSFRTANDDRIAADVVQRQAEQSSRNRPRAGLVKAFSSTNNLKRVKTDDPRHLFDVLISWVAAAGSPGVAEVLISKLSAAGVDPGGFQIQKKSSILSRRRSFDVSGDRSRLLKLAIEANHLEMVHVLLPYADSFAIDDCLPSAIRSGNEAIVELLLRYGANVGQKPDAHEAFRQACLSNGQSRIVSLILRSSARPPSSTISAAMCDAARAGSLDSVLQLSQSTADGNYNQADALKSAIDLGRRDIVLAIIMGSRPPQRPGLDEAFHILTHHPSLDSQTKLDIAELLLCAGAAGPVLAEALERSCQMQSLEMSQLLVKYGTSVDFNNAAALKTAVSRGDVNLVRCLLQSSTVSPGAVSSCVPLITKLAPADTCYSILWALLERGARGPPVDEFLIEACQSQDGRAVDLLLSPYFPEAPRLKDLSYTPILQGVDEHYVASVDYKGGEALRAAVIRGDTAMTNKLLSGRPSPDTLSVAFTAAMKLSKPVRWQMIELFLGTSLPTPCLHAALRDELAGDFSSRNDRLIKLLLDHGADINFSQGAGLVPVVRGGDVKLLQYLLPLISPPTATTLMQDALQIADGNLRSETMALLSEGGAEMGAGEIASALLQALSESPVDMNLLRKLLQSSKADINLDGSIVTKAVQTTDPRVLELTFDLGRPTPATVSRGLSELAPLPPVEDKARKLNILMAKSNRLEDVNGLLIQEMKSLALHHSTERSFSVLRRLLELGADANAHQAAALCHAVAAANMQAVAMLFDSSFPPTPTSLNAALPQILQITDPIDRLTLAKKLVDAGTSPLETNKVLVDAIAAYPLDSSLLGVLAAAADTSDGEALSLSVSKELPVLMRLILSHSMHSTQVRSSTLGKVMDLRNIEIRTQMCESLLKAGVSTEMASSALLIAARDGDIRLGDSLMAHGASISSNNGQAIVEACRGGSPQVLRVLLKADGETRLQTLEEAFQASTGISDLRQRAEIFSLLLNRGVKGSVVDAQLEPAARYGDGGLVLLKVLLDAGADPNYDEGEAVVAATRSAFIPSIEILLGLSAHSHGQVCGCTDSRDWKHSLADAAKQRQPCQQTLVRALGTCWGLSREHRFRIIHSLAKAGIQADDSIHRALSDAVAEENSERRLIELLLKLGASPVAAGFDTLVAASKHSSPAIFSILLQADVPEMQLNRAFDGAFVDENVDTWFNDSGLEKAKMLVQKGAIGAALSRMLATVIKKSGKATRRLSDQFVDLILSSGPDVDYNYGEPLKQTVSKGCVPWTRKLLELGPSAETLSSAFHCVFDNAELDHNDALQLCSMLAEYREKNIRFDMTSEQNNVEPILVRAMSQFPRSAPLICTLLDAGFYHDQVTQCRIQAEMECEEEATLLAWAIAQPQKRISTGVIEVLIKRGAKVNCGTSRSQTTPLMLAVQTKRPDLVKLLLLQGAEVDVIDHQGRSPLSMATDVGGDVAVQMMSSILAAEPSRDDGSLHNAARELNLSAVKVLVEYGHDVDFPSPLHQGRSVLGEVCLHGSDDKEMTQTQERDMQRLMAFLIDSGSDLSIRTQGKSLLYLCFDAANPVVATRALMKSGMWKEINKPFNLHLEGGYTYSPTMYVSIVMAESDVKQELIDILRAGRATDVFYAHEGSQPQGAIGLPDDLLIQERARKARLARIAEESEDFSISMARRREMAGLEQQILAQKLEMEEARRKKMHGEEMAALQSRAQLEESLASGAHQRRLVEQRALADAVVGRTRALAAMELETDEARQRRALDWEARINAERQGNARALSSIRLGERRDLERLDAAAEQRIRNRLDAQRKLVESQERLAKRLADGPAASAAVAAANNHTRQIGYVTELN